MHKSWGKMHQVPASRSSHHPHPGDTWHLQQGSRQLARVSRGVPVCHYFIILEFTLGGFCSLLEFPLVEIHLFWCQPAGLGHRHLLTPSNLRSKQLNPAPVRSQYPEAPGDKEKWPPKADPHSHSPMGAPDPTFSKMLG